MESAPHTCPQCGSAAYLGFGVPTKCVDPFCMYFDDDLHAEWTAELLGSISPEEQAYADQQLGFDFDDEDTLPGIPVHHWPKP